MCVCVTKLCVKDGVCESDVSATSVQTSFFRQRSNVICLACGITADLQIGGMRCQNRPETQLGKHAGKRNMNLMSKGFSALLLELNMPEKQT